MKIWIDDIRPAPEGYVWCTSVNKTIETIEKFESAVENYLDEWDFPPAEIWDMKIELLDMDHDAGDFYYCGGDYIKILEWMEQTGRSYPIRIHSMNVVGCENMRRIIKKNGWKEVF